MAFIPAEIPRVEPDIVERTWGAICGPLVPAPGLPDPTFWRVDVLVQPRGFELPASWLTFQFLYDPSVELSGAMFLHGVEGRPELFGLEVISAVTERVGPEEWALLGAGADLRDGFAPEKLTNRAQRRALRVKGL